METFFEKFGGRKMVLATFAMIGLFLLAAFKPGAINAEFIAGILGIVGLFSTANVVATRGTAATVEETEAAPDHTEAINDMQKRIDTATAQINTVADVIIKLTTPAKPVNTNMEPTSERPNRNEQAAENREAARQYLSQTFGG